MWKKIKNWFKHLDFFDLIIGVIYIEIGIAFTTATIILVWLSYHLITKF